MLQRLKKILKKEKQNHKQIYLSLQKKYFLPMLFEGWKEQIKVDKVRNQLNKNLKKAYYMHFK